MAFSQGGDEDPHTVWKIVIRAVGGMDGWMVGIVTVRAGCIVCMNRLVWLRGSTCHCGCGWGIFHIEVPHDGHSGEGGTLDWEVR